MKQNDGWVNALFSLLFIAVPAIVLFYFFLPSWSGKDPSSYGMIWGIAIGFWAYVGLLSFLLIYFDLLSIESLNFNIPIALALMMILVSYPLPLWATGILVIVCVLIALPVNILTTRIRENNQSKKKKLK